MEKEISSIISSICDKPLMGYNPEDWKILIMTVNSSHSKCSECLEIIKKLLQDRNYIILHPIFLDIIDFLVDYSKFYFIALISNKEILNILLELLKNTKDVKNINDKILYLIEKWGIKFANKKEIMPNFNETYVNLKVKGIIFPNDENIKNNYKNYIGNIQIEIQDSQRSELILSKQNSKLIESSNRNENIKKGNYGEINIDLNPKNYPKKFEILLGELEILLEYVNLDNEMIDNFEPEFLKNSSMKMDTGILDLTQNIQDLSVNLSKTMQKSIDNDKLLGICLGILDDLEQLNKRYEQLKNREKVKKFESVFKSDYAEYDMNNPNYNKNNNKKKDESSSGSEGEESYEEDDEESEEK